MNFISKFFEGRKLNQEQERVNELYEKEGLTDTVLNKQIAINKKRNELNISDPKQRINGKYVQ